jgi:hypothetical protein
MWDLWWTKWHWDRVFPEYFDFFLSIHSTGAPLLGKMKKTDHIYHRGICCGALLKKKTLTVAYMYSTEFVQ